VQETERMPKNWWRDAKMSLCMWLWRTSSSWWSVANCAFHRWTFWSPDDVTTTSCVGWNRMELTEPLCPTYCRIHEPVSAHQIRLVWSETGKNHLDLAPKRHPW